MIELSRRHRHVENKLHWVLDVTFGDDTARIAKKTGAGNPALLRKIALNMLRHASTPSKTRAAAPRKGSLIGALTSLSRSSLPESLRISAPALGGDPNTVSLCNHHAKAKVFVRKLRRESRSETFQQKMDSRSPL